MESTFVNWLLSFSPILLFLFLMIGKKWGGSKAGFVSWIYTLVITFTFFGANIPLVGYAHFKAVFLALDVLLIIWMALLFFHISNYAGAIQVLGNALAVFTQNKTLQVLLLAWLFTSFLQGLGGFGVPVAVTAPLLVGLGIDPIDAIIMASIGHGWAVTFGSMGSSFQTMMALSDIAGSTLAPDTAKLLGVMAVISGIWLVQYYAGFKAVLKNLPFVFTIGAILGGVQYLLATNGMWTVATTGASLVALGAAFVLIKIGSSGKNKKAAIQGTTDPFKPSLILSIAIYFILILLSFAIKLIPFINDPLSRFQLTYAFPEIVSNLGWSTAPENGREITLFTHPGMILLGASIIAFLLYRKKNLLDKEAYKKILSSVKKSGLQSSIAIYFTVGIAVLMSHTGMINILAKGLSGFVGSTLYPAITPFIGALGAFISGSNNNSNILFTKLHMQTAELLGLNVNLILAAQSAGGAIGSIFAPAKVIVGCSTVGLVGKEGQVLKSLIRHGLFLVACIAILTLAMS
ncbi:MAG TPA: L-lactate permease [Anaerolineaceae bacterium]|nr:L-lactate permease [Anaerolineaceae bacterium]